MRKPISTTDVIMEERETEGTISGLQWENIVSFRTEFSWWLLSS